MRDRGSLTEDDQENGDHHIYEQKLQQQQRQQTTEHTEDESQQQQRQQDGASTTPTHDDDDDGNSNSNSRSEGGDHHKPQHTEGDSDNHNNSNNRQSSSSISPKPSSVAADSTVKTADATTSAATTTPTTTTSTTTTTTPKHVLIVDDDNISRNVLSRMLQKLHYQITTAEGGREALTQLGHDTTFTLLLVDVLMPDIDGIELLRIFKRAHSKDIPIIMISSSEDPETIAQCFQSGAADFLQKPINFEVLKRRVEMCEMLRQERENRSKLTERIKQQERELQHIKSQISDTIETPMQVVVKECADLLEGSHSEEQYKGALIAILRSLGSRDLYKPAFSNVLEKEVDTTTFAWLQSELLNETAPRSRMPAPRHLKNASLSELRGAGGSRRSSGASVGSGGESDGGGGDSQRTSEESFTYSSSSQPSSSSPSSYSSIIIRNTITDLTSFGFDVFAYTQDELIENVAFMFHNLGLLEEFNVDVTKLFCFIRRVRESYHDDNPYHNFWHALDVTQFVYACLNLEKITAFLNSLDMFCLLIAALCHDLNHPGLNNNYQINAKTQLAILYNDISVLENHHASLGFSILNHPECNVLDGLGPDEFKEFRKNAISNILATDMAHHFEIVSKFQTRLQTGSLSKDNKDDKTQLMNIIIKCADVSNAVRPFVIAKKWADGVVEEFLQQGDKERELGLPISPLMDRKTMDKVQLQINFIGYLAEPLFKALVQYVPAAGVLLGSMHNNRLSWSKYLETQQEPPSPEAARTGTNHKETIDALSGDLDEEVIAKTRGFNILVIESHAPSSSAIVNLLMKNGYDTKCVPDMEAALELMKNSETPAFDAIVLDLSTTEDTTSFTKEVRQLEQSATHFIAILGLVHPDSTHNQQIPLYHEGINILVSKPIPAKDFISYIEKCIDLSMDYTEPVNIQAAIDQSGVDESFVRELLDLLIADGLKKLEDMKKYIAELDWANLKLQAHSLKGAASQLACKPLAQAAFVLERAGKTHETENLNPSLTRLERRLDELQRYVNNLP